MKIINNFDVYRKMYSYFSAFQFVLSVSIQTYNCMHVMLVIAAITDFDSS